MRALRGLGRQAALFVTCLFHTTEPGALLRRLLVARLALQPPEHPQALHRQAARAALPRPAPPGALTALPTARSRKAVRLTANEGGPQVQRACSRSLACLAFASSACSAACANEAQRVQTCGEQACAGRTTTRCLPAACAAYRSNGADVSASSASNCAGVAREPHLFSLQSSLARWPQHEVSAWVRDMGSAQSSRRRRLRKTRLACHWQARDEQLPCVPAGAAGEQSVVRGWTHARMRQRQASRTHAPQL